MSQSISGRRLVPCLGGLALLFALAVASPGYCGTELASAWRQNPITIDGSAADWDSALTLVKPWHARVGVRNDDANLYLGLEFDDPADARQVMALGLTLWVDPQGGKSEFFGIHFPLGFRAAAAEQPDNPPAEAGGGPGGADRTPEARERRFREALKELEILGPDKKLDIRRLSVDGLSELALGIARAEAPPATSTAADEHNAPREGHDDSDGAPRRPGRVLVYELRIPLHGTSRVMSGLRLEPGSHIGLRLETGEAGDYGAPGEGGPREGGGRGGRGGRGGGGRPGGLGETRYESTPDEMGPGGGGYPGGDGDDPDGGRRGGEGRGRWGGERANPIGAWIKVLLATGGGDRK